MIGDASSSHPENMLTSPEAVLICTLVKSVFVRVAVIRTVTDMIKWHSLMVSFGRQYGVLEYHVKKLKGIGG